MEKTSQNVVIAVLLSAFGLLMVVAPDLAQGAEASGRRAGLKSLIILVWGVPAGVLFVVAGGFLGYRAFATSTDPFAHKVVASKKRK